MSTALRAIVTLALFGTSGLLVGQAVEPPRFVTLTATAQLPIDHPRTTWDDVRAIRQRLRNSFDITLARFDLMAQLERHPEGLTMGELSRRMMVSGGNSLMYLGVEDPGYDFTSGIVDQAPVIGVKLSPTTVDGLGASPAVGHMLSG